MKASHTVCCCKHRTHWFRSFQILLSLLPIFPWEHGDNRYLCYHAWLISSFCGCEPGFSHFRDNMLLTESSYGPSFKLPVYHSVSFVNNVTSYKSRPFPFSSAEILYLWITNPSSPPPLRSWQSPCYPVSMNVTTLRLQCRFNHIIFILV